LILKWAWGFDLGLHDEDDDPTSEVVKEINVGMGFDLGFDDVDD